MASKRDDASQIGATKLPGLDSEAGGRGVAEDDAQLGPVFVVQGLGV